MRLFFRLAITISTVIFLLIPSLASAQLDKYTPRGYIFQAKAFSAFTRMLPNGTYDCIGLFSVDPDVRYDFDIEPPFELRGVEVVIDSTRTFANRDGHIVEIIGSDSARNPLLLIYGIEGLSDGEVITYDFREQLNAYETTTGALDHANDPPIRTIQYNTPNGPFTLIADGTDSLHFVDHYNLTSGHYPVRVEWNGIRQYLSYTTGLGIEENSFLLWSGDLDRDSIPDLLIDESRHYLTSELYLFLSSLARHGQVLGLAGEFITVGE